MNPVAFLELEFRAHDHLGWKRVGQTLFIKLWALEIMFSDLKPWFHISISESGRVPIRMTADALTPDGDVATAGEQPS